ncbi:MAG TPA: DUF5615 family PIN-like protein [Tepidiformaceae bacterium]|nr:DUF5615 family PIN-like protein [Tepidiformaceae bacterium]
MSRVRYYFDDDVGQTHLVRYLRELGIDCITSLEAGTFGASDEEHLNESAALGRVICTGNRRDFSALSAELLTRGDSHAGIVLIVRNRYGIGELARRLTRLADELSAEEMRDRIEYLARWTPAELD